MRPVRARVFTNPEVAAPRLTTLGRGEAPRGSCMWHASDQTRTSRRRELEALIRDGGPGFIGFRQARWVCLGPLFERRPMEDEGHARSCRGGEQAIAAVTSASGGCWRDPLPAGGARRSSERI